MFTSIINLSIQIQTILPRWTVRHSIFLLKYTGKRIHRFRLLHLYEADLNLALRTVITQRVRNKAEEIGLAEEQWGGRKARSEQTWDSRRHSQSIFANSATHQSDM